MVISLQRQCEQHREIEKWYSLFICLRFHWVGQEIMTSETFSVIIWCWYDQRTDTTRIRLVRADTGENVRLRDGSFLLRISAENEASLLRCFVRHIASGREAYIQGGAHLRTFIKSCLLSDQEPEAPNTGTK